MLQVALLAFIFCSLLSLTFADHHGCVKAPGGATANKKKWCDAANNGNNQYICNGPSEAANGGPHRVADYDVFGGAGKKFLEFGTPCGGGGYGDVNTYGGKGSTGSYCPKNWIVQAGGDTYSLAGRDDCAVYYASAPGSVSIYYEPQL